MIKKETKFIVCGFGASGKIISLRLYEHSIALTVIEKDELEVSHAKLMRYKVIEGNATEDVTLSMAGIENATNLITCLGSDSDNLFVILAARELNPNIHIIALGREEGIEKRLLKSGADEVMHPFTLGARNIASIILDKIEHKSITCETAKAHKSRVVSGYYLESSCSPEKTDTKIRNLMIKDKSIVRVLSTESNGTKIINPYDDTIITPDSNLVLLRKVEYNEPKNSDRNDKCKNFLI